MGLAARQKSTLLAQGKPRMPGGGPRPWRVRLYAPEVGGTAYQVMFKAPDESGVSWKRVLRRASSETEARQIFAQAEAALDAEREAPASAHVRATRTLRALGEAYLEDSRQRGKQPRTLEQRESRLNAHILPTIAAVPVAKWRVEHSRQVMAKGAKTMPATVRHEDPPGRLRWATARRAKWPAGHRRLPRPWLRTRQWFLGHPRRQPGFRGPVKNQVLHEVPLPRSLMQDELLPRIRELLGLSASASAQQVLNAQEGERRRRDELASRASNTNLLWWNYLVPPEEALWLFVDTETGLPVKPELHNERWHRIRAWVDDNDPDNAWPRTIVYRNLRDHAATRWFHEEMGEPWEVVALYLGDKLTTILNHYVRAGEDALRRTVNKLETL